MKKIDKIQEIGDDYISTQVPYVAMRMLPAILSALLVPVSPRFPFLLIIIIRFLTSHQETLVYPI